MSDIDLNPNTVVGELFKSAIDFIYPETEWDIGGIAYDYFEIKGITFSMVVGCSECPESRCRTECGNFEFKGRLYVYSLDGRGLHVNRIEVNMSQIDHPSFNPAQPIKRAVEFVKKEVRRRAV